MHFVLAAITLSSFFIAQCTDRIQDGQHRNSDISKHCRPHSRAAKCYQDQNRDLDRNRKDDVLLYDTHRLSGNADRIHDLGRLIIHDDHIRSLNGCVRTNTAHGNAYIRAGQNRSIIDAVTHKSQGLSL